MKGVARMRDFTDGYAGFVSGPSTGVLVNGSPVAVTPQPIKGHQHGSVNISSIIINGSSNVFAGGKSIVRLDDQALCGHKVISASANVMVP